MKEEEVRANVYELVTELTKQGTGYFEKSIEKAGLNLTGELHNSVDFIIHEEVGNLSVIAEIFFRDYGRYKDMKQLRYAYLPNIDAIEKWVETVGVEKFAWVNGYEAKQVPTVKNAKERVLWSYLMYRKKVPIVVQNSKNQWYNKVKMAYINVMGRRLNLRLAEILPKYLKGNIEG